MSEEQTRLQEEEREKPSKGRGLLVTEYSDLYYVRSLDTGAQGDVIGIVRELVDYLSKYTWCIGLVYASITRVKHLREQGWEVLKGHTLWVKPLAYKVRDAPGDIRRLIEYRALVDTSMFSEEFLERKEFARVILGEVVFHLEGVEEERIRDIALLRGYIELLIHVNGVFVLTLSIPVHGYELSSKDILRLRYLLEAEGVIVEVQRWLYALWAKLRRGGFSEIVERGEGVVRFRAKVTDILEAYSIVIKYVVNTLRGHKIRSMIELERKLRTPWDTDYTMVFTEILRGSIRTIDILRRFSIQLYSILHGTRKITSRRALERIVRRAYHYVPIRALGEAGFSSPRRLVIGRVVAFVTDTDAHIVVITRKYLGSNEYGYNLRLLHLTVIELVLHVKQSLRVFEYMFTHRKLRSIDELVALREEYSRITDYLENTYFIVDRDIRQVFQRTRRALEIDRLNSNVERKLETLNYIIMTKYQDRLSKMQLVLSVLFGIFGVPFFLFSYFQWYYDYVVMGKSPNFLPVTIATWIPTTMILLLTVTLYHYWRKSIYR